MHCRLLRHHRGVWPRQTFVTMTLCRLLLNTVRMTDVKLAWTCCRPTSTDASYSVRHHGTHDESVERFGTSLWNPQCTRGDNWNLLAYWLYDTCSLPTSLYCRDCIYQISTGDQHFVKAKTSRRTYEVNETYFQWFSEVKSTHRSLFLDVTHFVNGEGFTQ